MGFGGVVCFTYVPWRKMVLVHFLVPQEVPWTEESESRSCSKIMSTLHFAVNCVDYKWLIATFWWGPGVTAEVNKDSKEFEWQRRATQMRRNQGREDSAGWLLPRRRKSARYWRAYGCAHDTPGKFVFVFGVRLLSFEKEWNITETIYQIVMRQLIDPWYAVGYVKLKESGGYSNLGLGDTSLKAGLPFSAAGRRLAGETDRLNFISLRPQIKFLL